MGSSTTQPGLSKEKLSWEPLRVVNPMMKALRGSCFCTTTVQLSNLDMLFDYYNSVFFVYDVAQYEPAIVPRDEPVTRLLHALEELLVHYPCAAGLLVNNEAEGRLEVRYPTHEHAGSVTPDCHSAGHGSLLDKYGVRFQVAHADATLANLGDVSIPHPSLDLLCPCEPTQGTDGDGVPLHRFIMALQVTTFKCGGFALGYTSNHAYGDGYTAAQFLQNLCSIAKGAGLANPPTMSPRSVVIRARDPPSPTLHLKLTHLPNHTSQPVFNLYLQRKPATRFVFSKDALQSLKARVVAKLPSQFKGCSCHQILMSLLWIAHAQVRLKVHKLPKSHAFGLRFPINLRPKIPDITQGYVGNLVYLCIVPATLEELCESSLTGVVMKIKRTMDDLDVGESFQSMVDYLEMQVKDGKPLKVSFNNIIGMPSLVGLPFYDTNCGWGPPMYVGRPSEQPWARSIILDHPIARAWNVSVAFSSIEEHTCFQESIAEFLTS